MKYNPDISIVLLTYNCASRLARTVDHLVALAEKPRIIAVDNGSTDETVDVLHHYEPQVQIIALDANIGAAARNIGVKSAVTPYVAFCDDDSWWHEGALAKIVGYFEEYSNLAVIATKILIREEGKVDPVSEEMAHSPLDSEELPGHKVLSYIGFANAVRREVFVEIGGYEPRLFLGGEEELLATDIAAHGYEMRYMPDVIAHHYPSGESSGTLRPYGIRNALWFVWRRRHIKGAWRWTKHIIGSAPKNTILIKALWGFLKGVPWVIRTRSPVPAWLERELNMLDKDRLGASTRDYSNTT